MNYMEQVAQMLGVGLREEFFIKNDNTRYRISKNGMFRYSDIYNEWVVAGVKLIEILKGEAEIIKISKPILNETEKRYLSNVIKPFRDKVDSIIKVYADEFEGIRVAYKDSNGMIIAFYLPAFEKGAMYEGMELYKKYSVEDLGI